jgi:putative chitinase
MTDSVGPGLVGAGDAAASPAPDRYVDLLAHVAGRSADAVIIDMARSLAVHAPAYAQDATRERLAEFVAQIANETGGFRRFVENLNYRADVLVRQWPSHFTRAQAEAAHGNPIEIASRAYGGRMGNAPYPSQDGWVFRGRGPLQLTGRAAYRRYGELTGLPLEANPDMAADAASGTLIALAFFKEARVNEAIDRGDYREARRRTNGGAIGLENVAALRTKALAFLGGAGGSSMHPVLRAGSRGDNVRVLQGKLGLAADGIFGPGTEAAVRAFQQGHGLGADGIVGAATWAALG